MRQREERRGSSTDAAKGVLGPDVLHTRLPAGLCLGQDPMGGPAGRPGMADCRVNQAFLDERIDLMVSESSLNERRLYAPNRTTG